MVPASGGPGDGGRSSEAWAVTNSPAPVLQEQGRATGVPTETFGKGRSAKLPSKHPGGTNV